MFRDHEIRPRVAACAFVALALLSALLSPAGARAEGWYVKSFTEITAPATASDSAAEIAELKAIVAKRSGNDIARFRWWSVGGPAYRWNEIILDEMLQGFVTLPMAARHLALFHTALDDAMAASRQHRGPGARQRRATIDGALKASPSGVLAPSEHAAAAVAAAEVLGYLFPARAAVFAVRADEATRVRLLAGAELPSEVAAGKALGAKVAALAIARGKADGSDAKWTGTMPEAAGQWKSANPPIAPAAAGWKTWVLDKPGEVRPAAPPAIGSDRMKTDLAELTAFKRTPPTNHRATYWEVFGGARAHTLWNEIARTKMLEYGTAPATSARIFAALNIALADAGIACWEAKYAYWYPRPAQIDPDLKTVVPAPNHPSYPSAHSCFSTAAAAVLAKAFPQDAARLMAIGNEASEARIWAGIHYRFDIEAGQDIGRKVAEKTLARAFADRKN